MKSSTWLTPEEITQKKLRQKRLLVVAIPFIAIVLGFVSSFIANEL
ncbi:MULTISPECIES: hypothetical protein [Metabacillus]|nr:MULTISPECIES: hypothetical protein [Metabacillus]MCM3443284.1 hypothetical protein [Metabacillus halosaccharovorans]